MIRWSYLLPRVVLVAGILLAIKFAVPPMVCWSIVQSIRATTGAGVNIDRASVSFTRGSVRLDGVQLARDPSSGTNLVEFRSATMAIDLAELARRRSVIDLAEVQGLQFHTIRQPGSNASATEEPSCRQTADPVQCGGARADKWFNSIAQNLERRVEDEFLSIQLARELADHWPAEYDRLAMDVDHCRENVERLCKKIPQSADLPRKLSVQGLEMVHGSVQQARELNAQLKQLRDRTAQIAEQVVVDRQKVRVALSQDREKLRSSMRLDKLNGVSLNDALLNSKLQNWYEQAQAWSATLQWLTSRPTASPNGQRGVDILLSGRQDVPGYLIRKAQLKGELNIHGQEFPFTGHVDNLAFGTNRTTAPTRIHMDVQDTIQATIDITVDQVDGAARRHVLLTARNVRLTDQTWGRANMLAVSVQPGAADVSLELVTLAGEIEGQLTISARDVQLQPIVAPKYANHQLQQQMVAMTEDIKSFKATAHLTGTTESPRWQVDSDLGPLLRDRLEHALQKTLNNHAEQLARQADESISSRLEELTQTLLAKQEDLVKQLDIGRQLASSLPDAAIVERPTWERLLRH